MPKKHSNPSAHRSFHPDEYAPEPDRPRKSPSKEEKDASLAGTPIESTSTRGEEQTEKSEGMHDAGRRGKSQRPSGKKDASASTGVDPKDPPAGKDAPR
ncbi:hypothetical protein [Streptomyces sp. NPDC001820]|uniref:hypothetical protein n=1 Tax=Streptomyces sp. NPDC001820 TaxID=3364613 RepID=UPI00369989C2